MWDAMVVAANLKGTDSQCHSKSTTAWHDEQQMDARPAVD
jgi:hypothetical protein